jgi:ABC-type sulfate/molybdate transport systems ATPase subunit
MGQEPPAEVVNLSIEERERVALLGPDGAGRT